MRHHLLPFALGVVVGAVVARNWETLRDGARPLLREARKGGARLLEKGREAWRRGPVELEVPDEERRAAGPPRG